jgi:endonuclease/exonuclease/phosphatase family metal-dependent hydrolase
MVSTSGTLRVMTFNLRYAHREPPDLWPDRRPVVREILQRHNPDLLGTQEGEYHQLLDMEIDLPGYEWLGLGRDGGSHGEFMAIFYRRDRFAPLEYDHFWLSDTPAVIGSRTWGNRDPRMVTWARFRDVTADSEFYVLNTHLDHEVEEARARSAKLILERLEGFDPQLPLIATGDFNAPAPESPVYEMLVDSGAFIDTWTALEKEEPPLGTYHGFEGTDTDGSRGRIDWILIRGGVSAVEAEVIISHRDGQYPSDHFPVTSLLRYERNR